MNIYVIQESILGRNTLGFIRAVNSSDATRILEAIKRSKHRTRLNYAVVEEISFHSFARYCTQNTPVFLDTDTFDKYKKTQVDKELILHNEWEEMHKSGSVPASFTRKPFSWPALNYK